MKNPALKELLIKSFDSELSGHEQAILDQALNEHPELRQMNNELAQMRYTLMHLPQAMKPVSETAVLSRIERFKISETEQRRFVIKLYNFSMTAAAAILLLAFILFWKEHSFNLDSLFGYAGLSQEEMSNLFANY
jgi:hypothetical protein